MTDTYRIEMLSKMTMVEIMEKMNSQEKIIKVLNEVRVVDAGTIKIYISEYEKLKDEKKELKRKYIKSDAQHTTHINSLLNEIKELKNKLTKPKRKQIKATKNDLQRWLDTTERVLTEVIETNYENAEPDDINTMFDIADGRYNNNLRPQFRGIRIRGYPDKVDDELY